MTTGSNELVLEWLDGRYAVCRLEAHEPVPAWAGVAAPAPPHGAAERPPARRTVARHTRQSGTTFSHSQECENVAPARSSSSESAATLLSITRTDRELSIVIDESRVPEGIKAERGFIALRIKGTLDFSLVGVLAKLTGALAAANVPVFVISTFETDVLLVPMNEREKATAALAGVAVL